MQRRSRTHGRDGGRDHGGHCRHSSAGDAGRPRPDTIDLPAGFAGEGVAGGAGNTFYAGSLADGRIARGQFRRHEVRSFSAMPTRRPAASV